MHWHLKWRWLLRVILWGGIWVAQVAGAASQPTLVLNPQAQSVSPLGSMGIHVDETGVLTLDQARHADYTTLERLRSGGFGSAAHWYHFKVQRQLQARTDWVLALAEPYLDDVRVWTIGPDGVTGEHQLGDHFPFTQRQIKSHSLAVHLELSASGPTDIYVRVQSISALNFNAMLWQPDAFFAHESAVNLYQGLYFGVLMVFVLINLLFAAWLRDPSMLTFAGYVASLVVVFLGLNGYTVMLVSSAPAWFNDAITGTGVIGGIAAAVYLWSQLFALQSEYPKLHRAYVAMALLCLALLPLSASSYYRSIAPALFKLSIFYMFSALILVAFLWHRSKKLEFLFYLLAVLINVIGALTQMTMSMGWLPLNAATEYGHQILSLVQALFMTLGLLIRIGKLQSDRLKMKQAMDAAHQRTEEQRRFVAMLSHEFRTPLAVIDRSAQMVLFNTPSLASADNHRMQTIRGGVGMLSTLVDSFLTTESIRHNQLSLNLEACTIKEFLETETAALGEDMAARVRLLVTDAEQSWLMDKTLMGMALRNLLINALRYSPQDSTVTLTASVDNDALHIVVTDSGPGLSAQELQQLGQPYYRASSSYGKQGTGLGYYFSSKIIAAHGASLDARNASCGGLVVSLSLPRHTSV
jgi:signal transduction histidine kinase